MRLGRAVAGPPIPSCRRLASDRAGDTLCVGTRITYAPGAALPLSRCATATMFVSAPQRSCPAGVRAYHIVGGDVGFARRSTIPSPSSLRRRAVSIFAETPLMSVRSSVKQRSPSRRYQITSDVHAPASSRTHSFSGHPEGGGGTVVLRRLTTKPSYQMVTRF